MGHSSSEDSDREHYRHLKHEEKMERKRRKRMLKHARRNPGLLLPIDYHEYPESSHHGLIRNPNHHHHHHHHHGGLRERHERPGLISLIGGVVSALAGGHRRSRSAPPLSDLNYNNNQPGLPRQYPAPGYPPPDHDNQFVPYGLEDKPTKSTGPTQEYVPPPGPPPAYSANPRSVPPSGFRFPLNTAPSCFPQISELGTPPCFDLDGSPLYFGSAFLPRSVHPCKVGAHLEPHALLAYGGREQAHSGRYDLLPFSPQTMELVRASHGQIPPGRRPVEGGYEENGAKLYHAVATLRGVKAPGKAGVHLGGANVGFGGEEFAVTDNYEVLCWK